MLYVLTFDDVILKQLKKAKKDKPLLQELSRLFDFLTARGPEAGKLLDNHLFLYELKMKHPPLRLYYHFQHRVNEIHILEYEMKTSPEKQRFTLARLRWKLRTLRLSLCISFLWRHFLGIQGAFCRAWYCATSLFPASSAHTSLLGL